MQTAGCRRISRGVVVAQFFSMQSGPYLVQCISQTERSCLMHAQIRDIRLVTICEHLLLQGTVLIIRFRWSIYPHHQGTVS